MSSVSSTSTFPTAAPVVSVTASAAAEIKQLLTKPENLGRHLRVYVEPGGCSGMQYGMVFDEKRDGDLLAEIFEVTVLVDPVSADLLRGSVLDFSDSLTGGGFKLTNPNAKQSCGLRQILRSLIRVSSVTSPGPVCSPKNSRCRKLLPG